MSIMTELYGKLANVPYVRKKYSNFMATIDVGHTQQDMPLFLAQFEKVKKDNPAFFYKLHVNHDHRARCIF
jgi:hypothetical protein